MMNALPVRLDSAAVAVGMEGVVKRYGRVAALGGLDLTVPEGSVYAIVGQNGAGKTTTLRILLDLVRPDSGRVELFGREVAGWGSAARARLAYVPEGDGLGYDWMEVGRLLRHHAVYYPTWDAAYADRLVRVLGVSLNRRYGTLSKGQRRRVQLVMALAHRPTLLLLDEPTDGLDPVMRDEVRALLAEHLADAPATVVVSTHRVYELEGLVDYMGVLRAGRVAAQVSSEELRGRLRRYRVRGEAGWESGVRLNGAVLARSGTGREAEWTVWGAEAEIVAAIGAAGGVVSDIEPLTLDDAALTILRTEV